MFNQILLKLDAIAAQPSTNDKTLLLEAYLQCPQFRKVVVYMLNPHMTFGILDFSTVLLDRTPLSNGEVYQRLDQILDRGRTGNAARESMGRMVARGFPAELLTRILTKDPKAGFGITLANKAYPGLFPEYPYQRCSLPKGAKLASWDWKAGVISQEKADGMYCTINRTAHGAIIMRSRQGTEFDSAKFPNLVSLAITLLDPSTQTQGELLVVDPLGEICAREIGNGMLNSVAKGGDFDAGYEPIFKAWDQIPLEMVVSKVKYKEKYSFRLANLERQIIPHLTTIRMISTRTVYSLKEAYAHCKELMLEGKEGTIISEPNAPWIDGTSKFKVKLKLEATVDLYIAGYRPGKGKNEETFGSIICRTSDNLLEVAVSGFLDKPDKKRPGVLTREQIWEKRGELFGSIMAVTSNLVMVPSGKGLHSLFLPRFAEFRLDKEIADTLQQVHDQFEAAINAMAAVS